MVEIVFDEQTIKYVALFQDLTRTTVVDCVDATDKLIFVANVFRNFDVKGVQLEQRGDIVHATVTVEATKKGRAIGKEGRNLRVSRDLIARHHPIQSVSVA